MALFEYRSCTNAGRLMTGTIEAADADQARAELEKLGLQITEVEQVKAATAPKPVGRSEFLLFNEQLASLAKTGIPLERGLRELAEDAGSSRMKTLVNAIADDMEKGVPIEQAVEKRQQYFPPLYGMILKAGVETGRLSDMLSSLNRHLTIEYRTRHIVFEALTYPAVVLLLAALIVTFVFVIIVPTFYEILSDMSDGRSGLPLLTQVVFKISQYVWSFWIGAGILAAALVFLWISLSASAEGRAAKEFFITKIPLLGRVYTNGLMARFSEIMAVMINAGCTMDTAIELSGQSSGSERLKRDCGRMAAQLRQGFNIYESGMACSVIPRLFLYSVQLGSQRNELKENLDSLGQMYASKTYSLQSQLQAILLPALIVGVGCIVGLIVLSMFLPMVKMVQVLM